MLSLIALGSPVAFNHVVSLSINGLYTSYLIGNSLLLYRRLTGAIKPYVSEAQILRNTTGVDSLTWDPWRIPELFGTLVNLWGCVYMTVILFFSYWPTAIDPSVSTMNYSSLMVGATMLFSTLYYLVFARKRYTGPIVEVGLRK